MSKIIIFLLIILSPLFIIGSAGDVFEDSFRKIKRGEIADATLIFFERTIAAPMTLIGSFYEEGNFLITQDSSKAVEWYQFAEKRGDELSTRRLAYIYYFGQGNVSKDRIKAEVYLSKVVNGSTPEHTYSQVLLGQLREDKKDYRTASYWYKIACKNGDYRGCSYNENIKVKAILSKIAN